jgi:long-chain acyl-CoA synthetase
MQNFYEQFAAAAERHSGRVAVELQHRDALESVTYAELRSWAERTAAWLAVIGVSPGERCLILADNDARWCAAYLGILRLGAIAVPLDTAYKAHQIEALARDCTPRVVFTTARYASVVREALSEADLDCRLVLLHGVQEGLVRFDEMTQGRVPAPPLSPCPASTGTTAVILYTSGTTSDPKGVALTHGNLLAERQGAFDVVHVDERDAVLGVLPLFHALAQMANLLLPFSVGARVVFLESLNTTELLRALRERRITVFACVPQFFYLIHQRVQAELDRAGVVAKGLFRVLLACNTGLRRLGLNLGPRLFRRVHGVLGGRMRLLVTGGSRFDPATGRALYGMGFNVLQAYGLTETSGAATLVRPGDAELATVGPALPGNEIRIDTPEAGGTGDGEVLIRGPIVMKGYYNRPEATAAALRDGWLYTGDLGRLDSQGRLTITGRRKEVIVLSSGKNIYPEEVEAAYLRSSFIKELCVMGMSTPDEPSAERLYAVVVPDEDVVRARKIANVGDLVRFEMEGASIDLPHHKRVLGYEVWMEPLPRTTTGKLKRFEIERRVREGAQLRAAPADTSLSDEDSEWMERADVAPAVELMARAARPGTTVRPEGNLELDLGLDSMERVELLTALTQRYGAEIPEDETQQLYTVRQVVEALLAHGREPAREEAIDAWPWLLAPDTIDDRELDRWLEPHPVTSVVLLGGLKLLLAVLRLGIRVETAGLNRLPASGPCIITPNHQSYLDPFFLVATLPLRVVRQLFFVGASEYFQTPLRQWLARQINLVPVDPDAGLVPAMQAGAAGLRKGRMLVLFPEGERSIDGTVRHFKKGAAILSHHLNVATVPVAIDGLFDIWPRNRGITWRALLPGAGTRVRIEIGRSLDPASAGGPAPGREAPADAPGGRRATADTDVYGRLTTALRQEVERLWLSGRAPS